jgi:hypothetical protein
MLAAQQGIAARATTLRKGLNGKPSPADRKAAGVLAAAEKEIAAEAGRAIALLEADASVPAFAEVLTQVRNDMGEVARLLRKVELGRVTQAIMGDVGDILTEMCQALAAARKKIKKSPRP